MYLLIGVIIYLASRNKFRSIFCYYSKKIALANIDLLTSMIQLYHLLQIEVENDLHITKSFTQRNCQCIAKFRLAKKKAVMVDKKKHDNKTLAMSLRNI